MTVYILANTFCDCKVDRVSLQDIGGYTFVIDGGLLCHPTGCSEDQRCE